MRREYKLSFRVRIHSIIFVRTRMFCVYFDRQSDRTIDIAPIKLENNNHTNVIDVSDFGTQ